MTNLELKTALRELEARVKLLEEALAGMTQPAAVAEAVSVVDAPKSEGRSMCPKCGVKPNHYFHVKTCRGKQED